MNKERERACRDLPLLSLSLFYSFLKIGYRIQDVIPIRSHDRVENDLRTLHSFPDTFLD